MTVCIVIPARMASTRLPGKMLLSETGKPLIQHTYENAKRVSGVPRVVVATEDREILDSVSAFGGDAILTKTHDCGSSRISELAETLPFDLFVNIQGDEPEVDPLILQKLIEYMQGDKGRTAASKRITVATVAKPFLPGRDEDWLNPNRVKVVFDRHNRALYFSRKPLAGGYHHLGIYAYTKDEIRQFASKPRGPLEVGESLEQLRFLENGVAIGVVPVARELATHTGIDTPEDYAAFVSRARGHREILP